MFSAEYGIHDDGMILDVTNEKEFQSKIELFSLQFSYIENYL